MTGTALSLDETENRARVVGHVDLEPAQAPQPAPSADEQALDFLDAQAACPWSAEQQTREYERVLAEIGELQAENRWEDIIALFHPVEEKLAGLEESGLGADIRLKVGFALGRAGRNREAIACMAPVLRDDPENSLAHYSLAYSALDALFAARASRQPLPRKEKKRLLETAHVHFEQACRLRPDSVTCFYRHGVLFKEIENKTRRAIPLFERAIANWEGRGEEAKKRHHQQFPKYIKAMYHLASCLLDNGRAARSLVLLEKVLTLDQERNHMQPLFKHFAMGKVLFALNRPSQALEHLELATLESRCAMLGQIFSVLRSARELSLREEKILLGTLAHLPRGRLLLHHLFTRLPDYNRPLLDYKISRVRGTVLGCKRIHSLLERGGELPCRFEGDGYPHPLRHLDGFRDGDEPKSEKVENLRDALLCLKTAIRQVERFM